MAKNDSKPPIYNSGNTRWFGTKNFRGSVPGRWIGFFLAILGVWILSSANISTQWVGWSISAISCAMWVYYGYKDKDWPRMWMEIMFMFLAIRAVLNWINM
jgi:hypothetical protein